jgi:hypothetical protein
MRPKPSFELLKIASFLVLASLTMLTSSCGHTQASPPEVPMDVVMKTIHDYQSSHAVLLSTGSVAKPDENDDLYRAHIASLLVQEDFAQLEKMAEQNRTEKGRLLGGYWKNNTFFFATGYPQTTGEPTESDYQGQIETLKKWVASYPQSATARISLATLYLNYASFARGSGYANTVTDGQWRLFHERTDLGKQLLLEAARLKERDPYWYASMQQVAQNDGWDKRQARALLDQAVALEPSYYHYYRLYAEYLLPQWYGQPGDIPAFGEEVSRHVSEPDSSILYFQIVSSIACFCQEEMQEVPRVSYPKVQQGYNNLTRLYGTSNLTANRFAFFATSFKDQPSAQEAFAAIDKMEPTVWRVQTVFDGARTWANTP